jgi:hypothetical protein
MGAIPNAATISKNCPKSADRKIRETRIASRNEKLSDFQRGRVGDEPTKSASAGPRYWRPKPERPNRRQKCSNWPGAPVSGRRVPGTNDSTPITKSLHIRQFESLFQRLTAVLFPRSNRFRELLSITNKCVSVLRDTAKGRKSYHIEERSASRPIPSICSSLNQHNRESLGNNL